MDSALSYWTVLAAANRWGLYTLTLLACGSALFILATPLPQTLRDVAARLGMKAAGAAILCFLASLGLGGGEMMDAGPLALGDMETWRLAAETTLGQSAAVGISAMVILWCGYHWQRSAALAIGATGGLGSFLLTGHAATAAPAWIAAPAVAAHVAGAAYWIGALYPLQQSLQGPSLVASANVIAAFSYRAVASVIAIVISGVAISWIQLGRPETIVDTAYGYRLMVKIGLFISVFALAGYNKLFLTPQIQRGDAGAGVHLCRVIALEFVLILLILGAAVTLTLVEPPRALIQSPHAS